MRFPLLSSSGLQLLGLGNPLLDMIACVDAEFLSRHNLNPDDQILVDDDTLHDEIANNYTVCYRAGGSVQNTLKVTSWLLKSGNPRAVSMMGCVGNDKRGLILSDIARKCNLNTVFQKNSEYPTGVCAALISGANRECRSLVTKLDAAMHFNADGIIFNWELIDDATIIYSSGYFLSSCPHALISVGRCCHEHKKIFAFNISSNFVPKYYKEELQSLLPYVDILFGNETEFLTLAAELKIFDTREYKESDRRSEILMNVVRAISQYELAAAHKYRIAIMTRANRPIIFFYNGSVHTFDFKPAPKIVDTIGVGDAFVGGFLADCLLGKSIDDCMETGCFAASKIICQIGCTVPNEGALGF